MKKIHLLLVLFLANYLSIKSQSQEFKDMAFEVAYSFNDLLQVYPKTKIRIGNNKDKTATYESWVVSQFEC